MTTKPQQSLGNAAEKLKLTRVMPNFQMAPLPPEGAPAVSVASPSAPIQAQPKPAVSVTRRPCRLSSYLTVEAGARLDRLVAHFKATRGRKNRAPEVIEEALLVLERELGLR